MGLLHEIGHCWDYPNYIKAFEKNNQDADLRAEMERNAWAWALKKAKEFRKIGFFNENLKNQELIDMAKACLYSYADNFWISEKSKSKFLKKRL